MDNNNFDRIGKKMPYSVPEGFFDEVEDTVMTRTMKLRKRNIRQVLLYGGIAAAVIALLITVAIPGVSDKRTEFSDVALAFDNLTEADQSYLLEVYQDDIFMDQ